MSLEVKTAADGKSIEMNIRGRFNFDLHRQFRDAYVGVTAPGCCFRINLAATEYMDSSALGMLLLLKEHASLYQGRVLLVAPAEGVRRVLEIARFDQLFRIEG